MKVKIIGKGFIGGSLEKSLLEDRTTNTYEVVENDPDIIFYCAGITDWNNTEEFYKVNYEMLKECIKNINVPIVYVSSIHFDRDNDYGRSKRLGESATLEYDKGIVYRLQNTFGDGAKPNHHSVVATWMYNIKHDLPININDTNYELQLNYIDDVINAFKEQINETAILSDRIFTIYPTYTIKLGELLEMIINFKKDYLPDTELEKKLYKTYRSY